MFMPNTSAYYLCKTESLQHTKFYSISAIVKSPKSVPIVSVTILLQSSNMALRLLSD